MPCIVKYVCRPLQDHSLWFHLFRRGLLVSTVQISWDHSIVLLESHNAFLKSAPNGVICYGHLPMDEPSQVQYKQTNPSEIVIVSKCFKGREYTYFSNRAHILLLRPTGFIFNSIKRMMLSCNSNHEEQIDDKATKKLEDKMNESHCTSSHSGIW